MKDNETIEERFDKIACGKVENYDELLNFFQQEITQALQQGREEGRKEIVELIVNAGENKVSKLDNSDNFTGTYWVSMNDLVFQITGKYLSELKTNKDN